ncbi:gamma-glutamyltransferase [soil metagenome]
MTSHGSPAPVAIAAPHAAAVDAARDIVAAGGTVVDAAVAAAAVLTVVYPHMCSIGGDAIMMLRRPDGTRLCLNASGAYGTEPSAAGRLRELASMPVIGPLAVSVPGLVSGWAKLLELGGSMPVATLLEPAIELARRGFPVSPNLARALGQEAATLAGDPGCRATLFNGSRPLALGETLTQDALGDTLAALARNGLDDYYRGTTAARLAAAWQRLGVPITKDDLARHQVSVEAPLTGDFGDYTVSTAAPNSQGYALLYSLGAVQAGATQGHSPDAGILAEIFFAANAHRDRYLADPRWAPFDVDGLLTQQSYRDAYDQAAGRIGSGLRHGVTPSPKPTGDTIGIAAVCADGTAVSLIQSVFHSFGAQLLDPSTGVLLHNRASFFSLDPHSPNRVEPGKRPGHTLVPVIVEHREGAVAAHSTMGGKAQTQIHTQLLLRCGPGVGAQEVVAAPRFIVGARRPGQGEDHVMVEPTLDDVAVEQLRRTSLNMEEGLHLDDDAGHSMIARVGANGVLDAGADPRSDGSVYVGART